MNWTDDIDTLDLDDHQVLDNQIDPVYRLQACCLVQDRNRLLNDESKSATGQFELQTGLLD